MTAPLVFVGLTTLDIVQMADEFPPPNTKGWARRAYVDAGGPAANAAITARILGSRVILETTLGDGPATDLAAGVLEERGVVTHAHSGGSELPVSSIWVTGSGDRTLLSTAAVTEGPQEASIEMSGAAAVLSDGFYPQLALAAAREAAEQSVPLVLDCGSWREVFEELLPVATVVIAGDQFRFPDQPDATAAEMLALLVSRYRPRLAAVSRGDQPVLWATAGEAGTLSVPRTKAVDTLGAGDVLHGAFMHFAFDRRLNELEALRLALEVASRSCEHFGTRRGVELWSG
jgi:sugar/nucleoside kinase (ribokinase family)